MDEVRDSMAVWVSREVLPHEGAVRGWLARRWGSATDVDDVIQEAYCRISALTSVSHIGNGRAYLFRTVQSVVVDGARRAKVVNAGTMTETDWWNVMDEEPLADRVVEARQEVERFDRLLGQVSGTCRRVIELRRIHGLSQRETARQLGVSERVVENHIARGLKGVLKAMTRADAAGEEPIDIVEA
jgi:RNA polymerase sigma-70 factor (ECF subfamily)